MKAPTKAQVRHLRTVHSGVKPPGNQQSRARLTNTCRDRGWMFFSEVCGRYLLTPAGVEAAGLPDTEETTP